MTRRLVVFVASLIGTLCVGGHAVAGVLTVGPGQQYPQIELAVLAAHDGDVVLVKAGSYLPFVITGKGVTVAADLGAGVSVPGGYLIVNLPAGKTVVVDRVNGAATDPAAINPQGLVVKNCLGAVRIQQCTFLGASGNATISSSDCHIAGEADGESGVLVQNSHNVAFTFCTFWGGDGSTIWDEKCFVFKDTQMYGGYGGTALTVSNSSVAVDDSSLNGGPSGTGGYSSQAGHGLFANQASSLVLVNDVLHGGFGGESKDDFIPSPGGPGGNGLYLDFDCQAWILDCNVAGGLEGPGWGYAGGDPALPIDGGGAVTHWSGSAKTLGFLKLVREGQTTPIGITGEPGESALLFVSLKTGVLFMPKAKGTLMLDPVTLIGPVALGVLASSNLSLLVTMPDLPPGVDVAEVYLQALLTGPNGMTLSSWGHLTLLDSSF